MKCLPANRRGTRALTRIELLIIIFVIVILAGLIGPPGPRAKGKALRINCASNLKQIGVASQIWVDDHSGIFPQASAGNTTNSLLSNIQWPTTGNPEAPANSPYTYLVFAAMSKELNTPKVVICPADDRQARTNFTTDFIGPTGAHNLGVSYFIGRDTSPTNPQAFLAGDRNICADSTADPIPNHGYGISPDGTAQGAACAFSINPNRLRNLGWSSKMHQGNGKVGLADGSVQQFSVSGLVNGLKSAAATSTNLAAQNYLLFP